MTPNAYTLNVNMDYEGRYYIGREGHYGYGLTFRVWPDEMAELEAGYHRAESERARLSAYAHAGRCPIIRSHDQLQWFLGIAATELGWHPRSEVQLYYGAPSHRQYGLADLALSSERHGPYEVIIEVKYEIANAWWLRRNVRQACQYRVASGGLQTFLVAYRIAPGLDLSWASSLNVSVLTAQQFLCWLARDDRPALEAV